MESAHEYLRHAQKVLFTGQAGATPGGTMVATSIPETETELCDAFYLFFSYCLHLRCTLNFVWVLIIAG